MKRIINNLEEIALYTVIAFIFGILIAKLLGHLSVEDIFTQVITIVQIFAVMVLCWIAGWKRGHGGE